MTTTQAWMGAVNFDQHRTVGPHRAFCMEDSEWCYPHMLCRCCDEQQIPAFWRNMNTSEVLGTMYRRLTAMPRTPEVQAMLDMIEGKTTQT